MFIIFVGFFAIVSYRLAEQEEGKKHQKAESIATLVENEIKLAKYVNDGYERTFKLPTKIDGNNYNITIVDNRELVVNYFEYEHVLFLPENVIGNIGRGLNEIKKIDSIVYLNNNIAECNDGVDNDGDGATDLDDSGCTDESDNDETNCGDGICEGPENCLICSSDCGTCPSPILLLMKGLSNVISFDSSGDVILKGTLDKLNPNPQPTADDEFILKDSGGNSVAIVNLVTGNMIIKGDLYQDQPTLTPSPSSNDFIVKDSSGEVVSYIDESGNFYLKGTLTENGNP
jgi:hypothetical protein